MFSGAQFSLYAMTGDFVPVILRGIAAISPYADSLRRETDDLSTLLVGPPATVVQALQASFVAAATEGHHVVLSATLSRGCPGESDDPICTAPALPPMQPGDDPIAAAVARFKPDPDCGIEVSAQISLYPLGTEAHMARIDACIAFLKAVGVYDKPKHFCSKIRGDASVVFAALERAFIDFAPQTAHVVMTLTVSAGSPTPSLKLGIKSRPAASSVPADAWSRL